MSTSSREGRAWHLSRPPPEIRKKSPTIEVLRSVTLTIKYQPDFRAVGPGRSLAPDRREISYAHHATNDTSCGRWLESEPDERKFLSFVPYRIRKVGVYILS